MANHNEETLDWKADIQLQPSLAHLDYTNGTTIALTGPSGFLGRRLLQKLVQTPDIKAIHCLAVRNPDHIADIAQSPKVTVHAGDLAAPDLGMTEDAIRQAFCFTDVVVHMGAEFSLSKPYHALRDVNVGSLREITRLSLEHNHVSNLQFVSTTGLSTLLQRDIDEGPIGDSLPDLPVAQGYLLTKLVAEMYLENVQRENPRLTVTIHRPAVIVGPDAPRSDVMRSILHYSAELSVIPRLTGLQGPVQLVDVDRVAAAIVTAATKNITTATNNRAVEYWNHFNESFDIQELGEFVAGRSGISNISSLPVQEWCREAEGVGLDPGIGKFLEGVQLLESTRGDKLTLRRAWNGLT